MSGGATFASAASNYVSQGGEKRFLLPLIVSLGGWPLDEINQQVVDQLARQLYPRASPATWNRQVFTPVLSVLNFAKVKHSLTRLHKFKRREAVLDQRQIYALLAACDAVDPELGRLCRLLYWTNARLSEALGLGIAAFNPRTNQLKLKRHSVELPETLAADILRSIPKGASRKGRLFRLHKGGQLYLLLHRAAKEAKVALPPDVGFDVFRSKVPQRPAK